MDFEPDSGQINLNDMGLLTLAKLVLTASTPFVGGLSLLSSENQYHVSGKDKCMCVSQYYSMILK